MPDPIVAEAHRIIGNSLDDLRRVIAEGPADFLNWRPAGPDTNPLAVIAVHVATSTRWWLSVAFTGDPPPRDRPAEFRTVVSEAGELLAIVDPLMDDVRALLATDEPFDPGVVRTDPRADEPPGSTVTAAWALLHATEHLREHVAHAELTRQFWTAQTTTNEPAG